MISIKEIWIVEFKIKEMNIVIKEYDKELYEINRINKRTYPRDHLASLDLARFYVVFKG